jgi:hypothetical protein
MERHVDVLETSIPKGRVLCLENAKGSDICVTSGCLWVTQENDTADYVLNPCQSFRVSRDGTTVAHALQSVSLRIGYRAAVATPSLLLGGRRARSGENLRSAFGAWFRSIRGRFLQGACADTPQPGGLA